MFEEGLGAIPEEIRAMRDGVDYRLEIKVRKFSLFMRPLTLDESTEIAAEVIKQMKGIPESLRNSLTENVILCKETLKKASTSDVGKKDFGLTDLVLGKMTTDEVQFLHKQYLAVCDRVNPQFEEIPLERVAQMVDAIKKKEYHPTELSFMELAAVCRALTREESPPAS